MTQEPRHGEDFLYDFYAILEIARDADKETISKAYRGKAHQWHTDPHQRLAPEIKAQMEQKMSVFNLAEEILLDPEKRRKYDAELSEWKGPISKTGMPIIGWDYPTLSSIPLLTGTIEDPDYAKEKMKLIAQLTGHDQNTFDLLGRLYNQSENPSPELEAAYREALRKKDLYLEFESQIIWDAIGYQRRPVAQQMTPDYASEIEAELQEVRQKIIGDVGERLALIGRGELKALDPGGEELTRALAVNPEQTILRYQEKMGERFDKGAKKIRELANARQTIIGERLEVLDCKYWPEQQEVFPRILIKVEGGENHFWFAFALNEAGVIQTDDSVDKTALAAICDSEDEAKKWIAKGYNIILFKAEDNVEIREQLRTALSKHFEKFMNA